MKLLLLIFLPFFAFSQSSLETHHCFFKPKSFTMGGSVSINMNQPSYDYNLRTYYNIREHICLGPEYTISNNDMLTQELNFVLHYIFETKFLGIYPVIGYSSLKEATFLNGAIVGAGIHRNFRRLTSFSEINKGYYQENKKETKINIGLLYSF